MFLLISEMQLWGFPNPLILRWILWNFAAIYVLLKTSNNKNRRLKSIAIVWYNCVTFGVFFPLDLSDNVKLKTFSYGSVINSLDKSPNRLCSMRFLRTKRKRLCHHNNRIKPTNPTSLKRKRTTLRLNWTSLLCFFQKAAKSRTEIRRQREAEVINSVIYLPLSLVYHLIIWFNGSLSYAPYVTRSVHPV